jgi:4-carboxymuconolactone decarboxylase
MTLLNPQERTQRGIKQQATILANPVAEPRTLFESSWRDYIFAEVWTRPGLDVRSRYLVSIASAASADTPPEILQGYVRGALAQNILTLIELREVALHFAIYGGWSRGAVIDAAITAVVDELGLAEDDFVPLRAEPWDPQVRLQDGAAGFHHVMTFGGPPPAMPFFEGGILNFVFGEAWEREGLDQRGRRWVTLVGVADSSSDVPIRTHIYAAMASGNASVTEMNEFVLQYAIHSGWPRASVLQGVVIEMAEKIKNGLTWDGKALEKKTDE